MPSGPEFRFDVHLHLSQYWPDPQENRYRPDLEVTLEGLLAELDLNGVAGGVLLQLETAPSVEETLREAAAMASGSGGRLLQTSTVDPTRGEEAVAHAVSCWEQAPDLVAIKLYPGYLHFYPHDRRLEPVYAFAARRGIPVFFHPGDTLDRTGLVKFARPIEVDEVAVRFPKVRFVLCHLGNPWVPEAAELVFKDENVWADTSGLVWPPTVPYRARMVARAAEAIQYAIDAVGAADRFLFGSDWPLVSLEQSVAFIEGLEVTPEDRAGLFGGNARRLLGAERVDAVVAAARRRVPPASADLRPA